MQFKADPRVVFTREESPIAIHSRLRWMNGGAKDRALAGRVVDRLRREQSADGSWGGSVAATIQNLFDLWLVGEPSRATAKAIDWLLEVPHAPLSGICGGVYDGMFFRVPRADRQRLRELRALPFTNGCGGFVKTGAALFFATVFGQGDARRVRVAYDRAEAVGVQRNGRWCSDSCGSNILQAVAIHPRRSKDKAMGLAIRSLASRQEASGKWRGAVPFFPTVFAFSRLDDKSARRQVRLAMQHLAAIQNKDGSWGRSHQAFHALVALDACERIEN